MRMKRGTIVVSGRKTRRAADEGRHHHPRSRRGTAQSVPAGARHDHLVAPDLAKRRRLPRWRVASGLRAVRARTWGRSGSRFPCDEVSGVRAAPATPRSPAKGRFWCGTRVATGAVTRIVALMSAEAFDMCAARGSSRPRRRGRNAAQSMAGFATLRSGARSKRHRGAVRPAKRRTAGQGQVLLFAVNAEGAREPVGRPGGSGPCSHAQPHRPLRRPAGSERTLSRLAACFFGISATACNTGALDHADSAIPGCRSGEFLAEEASRRAGRNWRRQFPDSGKRSGSRAGRR